MKRLGYPVWGMLALVLAASWPSYAQVLPMPLPPPLVVLNSRAVAPQAIDTQGWLLLDKDIQIELDGAVYNLYTFKFNKADKQFRALRRRYLQHPLAYFLLGLSTWWKLLCP